METGLTTDRMRLRPITIDDLDRMHALHNDPEVMRFLTGGEPIARETLAGEIRAGAWAAGFWMAEALDGGDWIGWFALHPVVGRGSGERELGYRLRASAWGRGYATEGARTLVAAGFADATVGSIFAQTMAVNAGSRRVMEKAGLRFVRLFHLEWEDPLPGAEEGEVEYVITRAEWRDMGHESDGRRPRADRRVARVAANFHEVVHQRPGDDRVLLSSGASAPGWVP